MNDIPHKPGEATGETVTMPHERDPTHVIRTFHQPWWERGLESLGKFARDHGFPALMAIVLLILFAHFGNRLIAGFERRESEAAKRELEREAQRARTDERIATALEGIKVSAAVQESLLGALVGRQLEQVKQGGVPLDPEAPPRSPPNMPAAQPIRPKRR
jgi:hypothetical protein